MEDVAEEPEPEEKAMSEVRNQLKSQDLATLEATSLSTVGGRVFPDNAAVPDLRALVDIAKAWGATHAPANGGPIGGTDSTTTHQLQTDSVEAVFTPTGKQLARVVAVQVSNSGGAPMTAQLFVGGVNTGVQEININPSEDAGFLLESNIIVGPSTPLGVKLTSGSASDASVKVAHVFVGV